MPCFLRLCLALCTIARGRLVSVADLHGDFDHAVNILVSAKLIHEETHQWIGGDATLVQTGDITVLPTLLRSPFKGLERLLKEDRGDHCKQIYELFFRLRTEAAEAGGRVINLLGNHEVMNMKGDWRYVSKGDIAEFGGEEERREAWAWDGWLGSEVRKFPAAVVVDRVLFVHAGLLPEMVEHRNLEELNAGFTAALESASTSKQLKKDEATLLGSNGPVWVRYYARGRPGVCEMVKEVLAKVDADRMVVGHTIQKDFHVHPRCHGQIILADTAISSVYGGAMSYVEYDQGKVQVMYPGTEQVISLLEVEPVELQGFPLRHMATALVIIVVLGVDVVIWRCVGCRKFRTI